MAQNNQSSPQLSNTPLQPASPPAATPTTQRNIWQIGFFIVVLLWILSVLALIFYFNNQPNALQRELAHSVISPSEPIINDQQSVLHQSDDMLASNAEYILFQGEKVLLGDSFNFSPEDGCVQDTTATLSAITDDSVTFTIKEINWKDELSASIEEITDYVVKDNDCISGRPRCMDVAYEYCFSLSNIDSVQNITYELTSRSTMPAPPPKFLF